MIYKKHINLLTILFLFFYLNSKTEILQDNSTKIVYNMLIDKLTGNSFIIDKERMTITATSKNGKTLWKTNPYSDSFLEKYRLNNPTIVSFKFSFRNGKEVISIVYNNSVFGYILKTNGKFYYQGRD